MKQPGTGWEVRCADHPTLVVTVGWIAAGVIMALILATIVDWF